MRHAGVRWCLRGAATVACARLGRQAKRLAGALPAVHARHRRGGLTWARKVHPGRASPGWARGNCGACATRVPFTSAIKPVGPRSPEQKGPRACHGCGTPSACAPAAPLCLSLTSDIPSPRPRAPGRGLRWPPRGRRSATAHGNALARASLEAAARPPKPHPSYTLATGPTPNPGRSFSPPRPSSSMPPPGAHRPPLAARHTPPTRHAAPSFGRQPRGQAHQARGTRAGRGGTAEWAGAGMGTYS